MGVVGLGLGMGMGSILSFEQNPKRERNQECTGISQIG